MILFEIDTQSISGIEFEGDTMQALEHTDAGRASHQFHVAWRWQADQSYSARAMHRKERLRYEQEA